MEGLILLLILAVGIYGAVKLTAIVNYWTFGENQERRKKQKDKQKEDSDIVKGEG